MAEDKLVTALVAVAERVGHKRCWGTDLTRRFAQRIVRTLTGRLR
jgi:hypothetical protein